MRDVLQGRSCLEGLDCLGTVWLVKVAGLWEFRMVAGFVFETEKWKGSGLTTGILEAGSTGARKLPMASNNVFPEILMPSWLFAASETRRHRLTFCQLHLLGHWCNTPVAEWFVWPQWLSNFTGWSAVNVNVSPRGCGVGTEFCFKIEA